MKIHLICYEGPEWTVPVKAFADKGKADTECKRMNQDPKAKHGFTFQDLSHFAVRGNIPLEVE